MQQKRACLPSASEPCQPCCKSERGRRLPSKTSKHKQVSMDSLRGSSVKIGTIQRILAWPLRKNDTHTSRSVNILFMLHANTSEHACPFPGFKVAQLKRCQIGLCETWLMMMMMMVNIIYIYIYICVYIYIYIYNIYFY